jgi:hypothetical protein
MAMLSAKLPVVQRLAATIKDRNRLIEALSAYLANAAEEGQYTVQSVAADEMIHVSDKVVHVVVTENAEKKTKGVTVHQKEMEEDSPNFKNSKDRGYALRVLALLRFEENQKSVCSYRTRIAKTTLHKLREWVVTFKERVTGVKRKRAVRKKKDKNDKKEEKKAKKGKKAGKGQAGEEEEEEEEAEEDEEDEDCGESGQEDADQKPNVPDQKASSNAGAEQGGGDSGAMTRAWVDDGGGKFGELMERCKITKLEVPTGEHAGEAAAPAGRAALAIRDLPAEGHKELEVKGAGLVFYEAEQFLGPSPYVVPEAFTSLTFRQQPIAHLVLDQGCPKPHHICCIIGRPDVYIALFHALVNAEKLADVRTLALLVPIAFHSADRLA